MYSAANIRVSLQNKYPSMDVTIKKTIPYSEKQFTRVSTQPVACFTHRTYVHT